MSNELEVLKFVTAFGLTIHNLYFRTIFFAVDVEPLRSQGVFHLMLSNFSRLIIIERMRVLIPSAGS